MRAQYHQCVPNPQRNGELISVQLLSMWALGLAQPDGSAPDWRDKDGVLREKAAKLSSTIQSYTMDAFENVENDTMNSLMRQMTLSKNKMFSKISEQSSQPLVGK